VDSNWNTWGTGKTSTLAAFPWYSNTIYEEDFSEAIDQDKDFLVSLFIIYIFD